MVEASVAVALFVGATVVAVTVVLAGGRDGRRVEHKQLGEGRSRVLASGLRFYFDEPRRWERQTPSPLDLPVIPQGGVLVCRAPAPVTSSRLTEAWCTHSREHFLPELTGELLLDNPAFDAAFISLRAKVLWFTLEGDELVVRANISGFVPNRYPGWPADVEQQVLRLMADTRAFVDAVEAAAKLLPPLPSSPSSSTLALPSPAPSSGSPLPIRGIDP